MTVIMLIIIIIIVIVIIISLISCIVIMMTGPQGSGRCPATVAVRARGAVMISDVSISMMMLVLVINCVVSY